MSQKSTIHLEWDSSGQIQHSISTDEKEQNLTNWVLAPSGPMFLAHQLGSFKPSFGLMLCSKLIQIMKDEKYVFLPINPTLKSADLVLVSGKTSVYLLYWPKHPIIYNSDNLEGANSQLVKNYFCHVYNQLGEPGKLAIKMFACVVLLQYFDFLEDLMKAGTISARLDRWSLLFSERAAGCNKALAKEYIAPDEWKDNPKISQAEIAQWVDSQAQIQVQTLSNLESRVGHLCREMDVS